jgi:hypothetical protein
MYQQIVLVTRKTRLEELVERFNTREQAKFYIEHMGLDFSDYDREHATYAAAVRQLRRDLEGLVPKVQAIDRGFLPNFLFTPEDLVVTVGQDGLVVNTAKYLDGQPVVAVNPDPARYDGILLPYRAAVPGRPGPRRRAARAGGPGDVPPHHHGGGRPQRRPAAAGVQRLPGRPADARLGPLPPELRRRAGAAVVQRRAGLDGGGLDRLAELDAEHGRGGVRAAA